ncbi:MAG TPA: BA14K family protein [Rhizobiaceae bacterium]|nr:BA14K family protein [Rhizobiaceae bacterium]
MRPGRLPSAHYDWCFSRYKSYDAGSNSYQPLNTAGRRQCRSPYAG